MRKFILMLSIFMFLSFSLNTSTIMANVQSNKRFSQGFYTMKDLGLSENISYSAQNFSTNSKALLIILDENQMIQQLLRIPPSSAKYNLPPLQNTYRFIIYGSDAQIAFS